MMTAGTTQTAIEAMKLGADYLLKPFDVPQLKQLVADALKAARDMKQVSLPRSSPRIMTWVSSAAASRCRRCSR